MRLWTLSPRYLDAKGLVAAWREGLLALAVLAGKTRGYRAHPQLDRFRGSGEPIPALIGYLSALAGEADSRGYRFDRTRIDALAANASPLRPDGAATREKIPVSLGQIRYEAELLAFKLETRDPARLPLLTVAMRKPGSPIELNPAFRSVPGGIAEWERTIPEILERAELAP